jgi:AbrB family looped-hinge helix DNA binding protein
LAQIEKLAGLQGRAMKAQFCRVSKSGRISLPAAFRLAIGLEQGGDVVVELDDNEIKIRTIRESVARAQAVARRAFRDRPDVSVDDFLAHRREDWGEE